MKPLRVLYFFVARSMEKSLTKQALALIITSSVTFIITLFITRALSIYHPEFGIIITDGLRFHHFNAGIMILEVIAVQGLFRIQKASQRFGWFLAYGVGEALLHDEQSMYLWLNAHDDVRWSWLGIGIWLLENAVIITAAWVIAKLSQQKRANIVPEIKQIATE